jgi:hypothetical protein
LIETTEKALDDKKEFPWDNIRERSLKNGRDDDPFQTEKAASFFI